VPDDAAAPGDRVPQVPLSEALPTWIKVALLSFGGPAGQIGVMHRLLVEERKWVEEKRFLHAMSYCMLLPGPEAQQLATYLGWMLHGTRGGLVAGTLFIIPGLVSLFVLSVLYAEFRDTTLVQGVFFGLKPAVMAVVLEALLRIGRRTLVGRLQALLAAGAFVAIFFLNVPFPLIVLAAGLLGYAGSRMSPSDASRRHAEREPEASSIAAPSLGFVVRTAGIWLALWFVPIAILVAVFGRGSVFVDEAIFFSKAAVVTFGGAYAVLAYIAQQAVEVYQWLAPGEMLDGLGMAETTPGPLIQVVQFVGFMGAYRHPGGMSPLAAGALGSLVTAWVTFVPCFLFVLLGAPFSERLRGRRNLSAALSAITAAVVGVILNLAVWFSLHTVFAELTPLSFGPLRVLMPNWGTVDWAAAALAVGAAAAMLRFRVGMVPTLAASAVCGLVYTLLMG
jgi:chromate transporter